MLLILRDNNEIGSGRFSVKIDTFLIQLNSFIPGLGIYHLPLGVQDANSGGAFRIWKFKFQGKLPLVGIGKTGKPLRINGEDSDAKDDDFPTGNDDDDDDDDDATTMDEDDVQSETKAAAVGDTEKEAEKDEEEEDNMAANSGEKELPDVHDGSEGNKPKPDKTTKTVELSRSAATQDAAQVMLNLSVKQKKDTENNNKQANISKDDSNNDDEACEGEKQPENTVDGDNTDEEEGKTKKGKEKRRRLSEDLSGDEKPATKRSRRPRRGQNSSPQSDGTKDEQDVENNSGPTTPTMPDDPPKKTTKGSKSRSNPKLTQVTRGISTVAEGDEFEFDEIVTTKSSSSLDGTSSDGRKRGLVTVEKVQVIRQQLKLIRRQPLL